MTVDSGSEERDSCKIEKGRKRRRGSAGGEKEARGRKKRVAWDEDMVKETRTGRSKKRAKASKRKKMESSDSEESTSDDSGE